MVLRGTQNAFTTMCNAYGIPPVNLNQLTIGQADVITSTCKTTILASLGNLPPTPPFEEHPYKNMLQLQNVNKYVIGTFPPISYLLDDPLFIGAGIINLVKPNGSLETKPQIPFYHGNRGSLWKYVLPPAALAAINAGPRVGRAAGIMGFLNANQINYADIISFTQRIDYNSNDTGLINSIINEGLIRHILQNDSPNILLLFNTSSTFTLTGLRLHVNNNPAGAAGRVRLTQTGSAFDLFLRSCQELGIGIEVSIPNGLVVLPWTALTVTNRQIIHAIMHNKVIFKMRLTWMDSAQKKMEKEFTIVTPPSPSGPVFLALPNNANYINWSQANPRGNQFQFINTIYQSALLGNPNILYSLNV